MPTPYQGTLGTTYAPQPVAAPQNQPQDSGAQQAASDAVVGNDAALTAALPFQPIGGTVAAGAFTPWDGTIP